MRYVLDKHAQSLGFVVDATESYKGAVEALDKQYQQFGTEYTGLLFGWPTAPQIEADELASLLEQSAYKELPVVVMSTDMRAETRAWVAEREHTAVLPWKEYQRLEALLQRLIEIDADDTVAFPGRVDNSDIHLLIVDDSATIRYSLRDLFQLQGYRVSLAATQVEAIQQATAEPVDIAILDFYLTETTGDLLCRELVTSEAVGDIICTVLTGTYSDHIIKRSLRAGAVECMFKNESSELLLSRIDAISRFVRQRRGLQAECALLEEALETMAGAVLVIDSDHRISYVNDAGLQELYLDNRKLLIGQQCEALLETGGPQSAGEEQHSANWRLPGGKTISIDYQHILTQPAGRSLLRFARAQIPIASSAGKAEKKVGNSQAPGTESLNNPLMLEPSSKPFIRQMQWYLSNAGNLDDRVSLMVMDVFVQDVSGQIHKANEYPALFARVEALLQGIHKRPAHVAKLTGNRFGFLLRHREETQVYLLVRKIMQLCIELEHEDKTLGLTCSGSLLSLVDKKGHSMETLLKHVFKGVELVSSKGPDQILLMDLRRMLNAYPTK
ncbi:Response regulator MprA [Granulosicoccus antarcticus IMCC3135]|uniref:Response regulator MprA n=2 Tax=Granulosicoccus TaxID=437504 RepID=A0A2Z2P1D4_9GAMM|nr:Response regulator MprA [Granulosicoccus antarcticus IMCC3135]